MKKHLIALCLVAVPSIAMAQNEHNDRGAFIGAAKVSTINIDCDSCDTTGTAFEGGYYFNKIVGIEAKFGDSEGDSDLGIDAEFKYFGANIGHTFNTSWVRFYGKAGIVSMETTETDYSYDYINGDYYYESYENTASDTSLALGIGVTFTPFAHQSGVYFKLESLSASILDSTIGLAQLSIGYQF